VGAPATVLRLAGALHRGNAGRRTTVPARKTDGPGVGVAVDSVLEEEAAARVVAVGHRGSAAPVRGLKRPQGGVAMKERWVVLVAAACAFACPPVQAADNPQQDRMTACNAQAGERKGDERQAFMSRCLSGDTKPTNAQQERMKSCNAKAGDKKGDERKAFMKDCLSAEKKAYDGKMGACNTKSKGMSGDERKKFMSECMKAPA